MEHTPELARALEMLSDARHGDSYGGEHDGKRWWIELTMPTGCPCGHPVISADTEDLPVPLCDECWAETQAEVRRHDEYAAWGIAERESKLQEHTAGVIQRIRDAAAETFKDDPDPRIKYTEENVERVRDAVVDAISGFTVHEYMPPENRKVERRWTAADYTLPEGCKQKPLPPIVIHQRPLPPMQPRHYVDESTELPVMRDPRPRGGWPTRCRNCGSDGGGCALC